MLEMMTTLQHSGLSIRHRRPEIMDQPDLDPREHAKALRGLARINLLSRTGAAPWSKIARVARRNPGRPLRVLDVASGGGDLALALAARARRAGIDVQVEGCDISPTAVGIAQARAHAKNMSVRFFVWDALSDALPEGYDVVACSLFLHHLDDSQAEGLLRRMSDAAGQLVLVDDLIRGRLGYALALLACYGLSRSRVVRFDGPASVEGAYTGEEAKALARRAGMAAAKVERHWPQRFLLSWSRP
jgi:SAM-dependent methyltransferase